MPESHQDNILFRYEFGEVSDTSVYQFLKDNNGICLGSNKRNNMKIQQQQQQQQQPQGSSRYKTELCRPFEEHGTCKYGDKCQFAHGQSELRSLTRHPKYKTEPCRTFHTLGLCPYGHRCHFIHNEVEYFEEYKMQILSLQREGAKLLAGAVHNQQPWPSSESSSTASNSGNSSPSRIIPGELNNRLPVFWNLSP